MTAQDLINLAVKHIGALASGETLNPEEYTDALAELNSLIASWDVEYLNIFCMAKATYSLVGSRTTPYTIGAGASDFNTSRPISIRSANVVTASGSFTIPLKVITTEQYAQILEQDNIGEPPEFLYYDNDYPVAKLYLNPWPAAADTLELYTWEQLGQLASLGTTFDMPPGYQHALEWNLAVALAPMFGRPVDQATMLKATTSKASIRANNTPPGPGRAEVIQAQGAAVPVPPDAQNTITR